MFDRPREKKVIFISHSGSEWCIIENCRHCCLTRHYRQLKYFLVRSASRIWVTHWSFAMRLCLYLIDSRFCKILRLIFGIFTEESRIIQNWVVRIGVDIPNDGSIFIKCFIFLTVLVRSVTEITLGSIHGNNWRPIILWPIILDHFGCRCHLKPSIKCSRKREVELSYFLIKISWPRTRWTGVGSAVVNIPLIEDPDIKCLLYKFRPQIDW